MSKAKSRVSRPLRVGILGLKGDPTHLFHLILAERARTVHNLDVVWFVPAGQPVDKKTGVTDKYLRMKLARKAIRNNRKFKVSSVEVDREGPSYMADTLRAFHNMYPQGTEFFLLIGEDRAPTIKDWHEPEAVVALCTFIVGPRMHGDVTEEWCRSVLPAGSRCLTIKIDNSSTFIRQEIAAGRSVRYLLADEVIAAIHKAGLYGARPPRCSARTRRGGKKRQSTRTGGLHDKQTAHAGKRRT